jgi:hypothetical protein
MTVIQANYNPSEIRVRQSVNGVGFFCQFSNNASIRLWSMVCVAANLKLMCQEISAHTHNY